MMTAMSPSAGHTLSKSTFLRGLQCHKSLYLNRFHKDLRDPVDPSTQAAFDRGHDVGELAQRLFPGGVLARASQPWFIREAVQRTQQLLDGGESVLYEPAFQYDGVMAYVDILAREGAAWHLYEVKSSTGVKEVYLPDAGIQAYILRGAGLDLAGVSIIHLNNRYVRKGELDLQQLFTVVSVLHEVEAMQGAIADQVAELKGVLGGGQVPQIDIGPHCTEPYDCDFIGHCWAHVPQPSVFDVARLPKEQMFGLYRSGILRIEDIPADLPLNETAQFQVEHHRSGQPGLDRRAVRAFLDSLRYPLYFLDFETTNPAVPPFDGLRPYGQHPFLYSLHRKESPSGDLEHSGFLAEAGEDPRHALAEALLRDAGVVGDVLVYSQSFEGTRIRELAEQLPGQAAGLEALGDRLRDLMEVFRQRQYYHPAMHGSYSIKAVLPALVPELGYDDLPIADGTAAMLAFAALPGEPDPARVGQIRQELWDYCQRDTLAMVRIVEALQELAG